MQKKVGKKRMGNAAKTEDAAARTPELHVVEHEASGAKGGSEQKSIGTRKKPERRSDAGACD